MIYGNIKSIDQQKILMGRLKKGLDYLLNLKPSFIAEGTAGYFEKVLIDGDDIFAMHQVYQTKSRRQARFEAHRQYIDLQFIWKGEELITVAEIKGLVVTEKYNRKKDIGFFEYKPAIDLLMMPGQLAVLFPTDAHAPCLSTKKKSLVYKTVIKIKI